MSDAKPELKEIAQELDSLTWAEVMSIAIQLNVQFKTLQRIEEQYSDINTRILKAIKCWLETDTTASWMKVVKALRSKKKIVLAQKIEDKYIPHTGSRAVPKNIHRVLDINQDLQYILKTLQHLGKEDIKSIGRYLGLSDSTVENIETGSVKSYLDDIIRAWILKQDNVLGKGKPTIENLRKALETVGQRGIARNLIENLPM